MILDIISVAVLFQIAFKITLLEKPGVIYNDLLKPLRENQDVIPFIIDHKDMTFFIIAGSIIDYMIIIAGIFTTYSIIFTVIFFLALISSRSKRIFITVTCVDIAGYLFVHIAHLYFKFDMYMYLKGIVKNLV
jgi:hypothetical protein